MAVDSTASLMISNSDIIRKIEAVRTALADHLEKTENDNLVDLEVMSVDPRPFSTIVRLRMKTPRMNKQLVMKTINHHPVNKAITGRENQAVVEYNILKDLHPKFLGVEGCSVPAPVLLIPEIETYLTEFVEGSLLIDEFKYARYFSSKDQFERLKEHYYLCGRWLKHFQEFTGVYYAGFEALGGVIERINHRLNLIAESRNKYCPKNLWAKVTEFVQSQLSKMSERKILVSGRHGDFGAWNIIAGPRGITVFDFLGYRVEPVAVDILKMLMNFEDERKYLAYSKSRIDILKESFLKGFGVLPDVTAPVLAICEVLHRVSSVYGCVSAREERLHRKIERYLCLKNNLDWLTNDKEKSLLWPIMS
jgi:hypothetical protein